MDVSVKEILGICGGASAVISAIVGYFAQRFADKRNERWRGQTETDLKKLEHQFSEKSTIFNRLIDAQQSSYSLAQEKRILAIEEMWQLISQFSFEFPHSISIIYNVLTEDEIANFYDSSKYIHEREELSKDLQNMQNSTFFQYYTELQRKLSQNRPFLGEEIHKSILVTNIFYSRVIMYVERCVRNERLVHWHNDKPTMKILKGFLSQEEYNFVLNNKEKSSIGSTIGLLESKILLSINEVIIGRTATKTAIERFNEIKKLTQLSELNN